MKKLPIKSYKASGSTKLVDIPTKIETDAPENKIIKKIKKVREKNSALQELMYAQKRYSLLVCLQGMDTSGKDGLIREVFKDFNTRGVEVHAFKQPTEVELSHGYLWRHVLVLPEKGKFGIFNRSHYENVLIAKVHPEIVLTEKLPGIVKGEDITPDFWEQRYKQINNFEAYLAATGTIVIKFFLHISKEEQRQRLLARLDEADKHWKFSPQDLKEREAWDVYMDSYETAIQATSTKAAPWYILPSDDKKMSRLLAAEIIHKVLKEYIGNSVPEPDAEVEGHIEEFRKMLG